MSELPLVSIVIPMRNEERRVGACLDSIFANDYPKERLEIIVVDGRSEDRSRAVVEKKMQDHSLIRLLDNPLKITSTAMNIGIRASLGDVLFMVNAHAYVSSDFIIRSVRTLQEHPEADAVGGRLISINEGGSLSDSIVLALNSPLGAGGRRYRTRHTPGLISDTVPYAAYRREVFDRFGLIDEELVRNQDAEFNYRLLQRGGKIYFNPEIVSYLHSRSSLGQLARQQFQTGYWKVRLFQKLFLQTNWRQLVPAAFVSISFVYALAATFSKWGRLFFAAFLGTYALAVAVGSLLAGLRSGVRSMIFLPGTFVVIHISYGMGTIAGFWDFVVRRRGRREPTLENMPESRGDHPGLNT